MSVPTRSTLRQRLFAFLVAGIGATAAVAVSFAMTVYDAANPEAVPTVAAGQSVDTGRWIVAVHKAMVSDTPPTGTKPWQPKTFVMVEFDLDNRSASSSYASRNLLTFDPPIPGLPEPVVYLVRDKWIASPINPGMPERLVAAWEWPPGRKLPEELRLSIGSQVYKRRDNLYGASNWFDRDPVARVNLPLSRNAAGQAQ